MLHPAATAALVLVLASLATADTDDEALNLFNTAEAVAPTPLSELTASQDVDGTSRWTRLSEESSDPCRDHWVGVTCHPTYRPYRVVALSLPRRRLVGRLPSSIGQLSMLSQLDLSHNELQGSVPLSVCMLASLQHLDVSHNTLSGVMPARCDMYDAVRSLDVSSNRLSGSLDWTVQLGDIRNLTVSYNFFSGAIPPALFSRRSQLRNLHAQVNELSGRVPVVLPDHIVSIDVSDNAMCIVGTLPDAVAARLRLDNNLRPAVASSQQCARFCGLQHAAVSRDCGSVCQLAQPAQRCAWLTHPIDQHAMLQLRSALAEPSSWTLDLPACAWPGVWCSIDGWYRVEKINLLRAGVTGRTVRLPGSLALLSQLQMLHLGRNNDFQQFPNVLSMLPLLHSLTCHQRTCTIAGALPSVCAAGITSCTGLVVSQPGVEARAQHRAVLRLLGRSAASSTACSIDDAYARVACHSDTATVSELVLNREAASDATVLAESLAVLTHLIRLEVHHVPSSELTQALLMSLPSALQVLRVSHCNVTLQQLDRLPIALPNLRSLHLNSIRVTDAAVGSAAMPASVLSHPQLTLLDISGSDFAVWPDVCRFPRILQPLPPLQHLNVSRSLLADAWHTCPLQALFPTLHTLDASDCPVLQHRDASVIMSVVSPFMRHLALANTGLTGALPQYLGRRAPSLVHLDLARNALTSLIRDALLGANVDHLYLQHNNLSGPVPFHVLPTVQHVNLRNNQMCCAPSLVDLTGTWDLANNAFQTSPSLTRCLDEATSCRLILDGNPLGLPDQAFEAASASVQALDVAYPCWPSDESPQQAMDALASGNTDILPFGAARPYGRIIAPASMSNVGWATAVLLTQQTHDAVLFSTAVLAVPPSWLVDVRTDNARSSNVTVSPIEVCVEARPGVASVQPDWTQQDASLVCGRLPLALPTDQQHTFVLDILCDVSLRTATHCVALINSSVVQNVTLVLPATAPPVSMLRFLIRDRVFQGIMSDAEARIGLLNTTLWRDVAAGAVVLTPSLRSQLVDSSDQPCHWPWLDDLMRNSSGITPASCPFPWVQLATGQDIPYHSPPAVVDALLLLPREELEHTNLLGPTGPDDADHPVSVSISLLPVADPTSEPGTYVLGVGSWPSSGRIQDRRLLARVVIAEQFSILAVADAQPSVFLVAVQPGTWSQLRISCAGSPTTGIAYNAALLRADGATLASASVDIAGDTLEAFQASSYFFFPHSERTTLTLRAPTLPVLVRHLCLLAPVAVDDSSGWQACTGHWFQSGAWYQRRVTGDAVTDASDGRSDRGSIIPDGHRYTGDSISDQALFRRRLRRPSLGQCSQDGIRGTPDTMAVTMDQRICRGGHRVSYPDARCQVCAEQAIGSVRRPAELPLVGTISDPSWRASRLRTGDGLAFEAWLRTAQQQHGTMLALGFRELVNSAYKISVSTPFIAWHRYGDVDSWSLAFWINDMLPDQPGAPPQMLLQLPAASLSVRVDDMTQRCVCLDKVGSTRQAPSQLCTEAPADTCVVVPSHIMHVVVSMDESSGLRVFINAAAASLRLRPLRSTLPSPLSLYPLPLVPSATRHSSNVTHADPIMAVIGDVRVSSRAVTTSAQAYTLMWTSEDALSDLLSSTSSAGMITPYVVSGVRLLLQRGQGQLLIHVQVAGLRDASIVRLDDESDHAVAPIRVAIHQPRDALDVMRVTRSAASDQAGITTIDLPTHWRARVPVPMPSSGPVPISSDGHLFAADVRVFAGHVLAHDHALSSPGDIGPLGRHPLPWSRLIVQWRLIDAIGAREIARVPETASDDPFDTSLDVVLPSPVPVMCAPGAVSDTGLRVPPDAPIVSLETDAPDDDVAEVRSFRVDDAASGIVCPMRGLRRLIAEPVTPLLAPECDDGFAFIGPACPDPEPLGLIQFTIQLMFRFHTASAVAGTTITPGALLAIGDVDGAQTGVSIVIARGTVFFIDPLSARQNPDLATLNPSFVALSAAPYVARTLLPRPRQLHRQQATDTATDTWYHVAVTWRDDGRSQLFLNGMLQDERLHAQSVANNVVPHQDALLLPRHDIIYNLVAVYPFVRSAESIASSWDTAPLYDLATLARPVIDLRGPVLPVGALPDDALCDRSVCLVNQAAASRLNRDFSRSPAASYCRGAVPAHQLAPRRVALIPRTAVPGWSACEDDVFARMCGPQGQCIAAVDGSHRQRCECDPASGLIGVRCDTYADPCVHDPGACILDANTVCVSDATELRGYRCDCRTNYHRAELSIAGVVTSHSICQPSKAEAEAIVAAFSQRLAAPSSVSPLASPQVVTILVLAMLIISLGILAPDAWKAYHDWKTGNEPDPDSIARRPGFVDSLFPPDT